MFFNDEVFEEKDVCDGLDNKKTRVLGQLTHKDLIVYLFAMQLTLGYVFTYYEIQNNERGTISVNIYINKEYKYIYKNI